MKRNSLTAIVNKSHSLLLLATCIDFPGSLNRYRYMIAKATVKEIIRLDGSPAPTGDVATTSTPGAVSDNQERICCNLTKPKL